MRAAQLLCYYFHSSFFANTFLFFQQKTGDPLSSLALLILERSLGMSIASPLRFELGSTQMHAWRFEDRNGDITTVWRLKPWIDLMYAHADGSRYFGFIGSLMFLRPRGSTKNPMGAPPNKSGGGDSTNDKQGSH